MSVASQNPFAALSEESSPAPAPPKETATPTPAAPSRNTQSNRGGASRSGRYYPRGGAKSSAPRDENAEINESEADSRKKRFDGEARGGRGGRGGRGRGGRGGRGGRDYDRHSATGITDSSKKLHQGWGGDEGVSELNAETAGVTDANHEAGTTAGDGWGAAATEDWGPNEVPAADSTPTAGPEEPSPNNQQAKEEEDNTLTYDQYLQQQQGLEVGGKLEGRKASDDHARDDAVALEKGEEHYFAGKAKAGPKVRTTKKKEKELLEIDAHFERPSRGRGGDRGDRGSRGGRGSNRGERGSRGSRGRDGRGRPNGNRTPAVDVDDQSAFPSLS